MEIDIFKKVGADVIVWGIDGDIVEGVDKTLSSDVLEGATAIPYIFSICSASDTFIVTLAVRSVNKIGKRRH